MYYVLHKYTNKSKLGKEKVPYKIKMMIIIQLEPSHYRLENFCYDLSSPLFLPRKQKRLVYCNSSALEVKNLRLVRQKNGNRYKNTQDIRYGHRPKKEIRLMLLSLAHTPGHIELDRGRILHPAWFRTATKLSQGSTQVQRTQAHLTEPCALSVTGVHGSSTAQCFQTPSQGCSRDFSAL